MIDFFVVEEEPTDPGDRRRWGRVADGRIVDADERIVHPVSEIDFETFCSIQKGKLEGVSDPVAVLDRLSSPPVVAGVPRRDGDGVLFADDVAALGSEGDLAAFERFEYDQYTNLDAVAADDDGWTEPERDHVVPDRFSVLRFTVMRDGSLHEVGRIDTATDEIVAAPHGEETLMDVVRTEFGGRGSLGDPVSLVDRYSGKTRRQVTVVDAETDTIHSDPRRILPKPNHPEHADPGLLPDPPGTQ